MKKTKKVMEMLRCNIKALVEFELLFKLLSFLIFTPIFLKSFTLIMKLTGYNYITIENVVSFLINPFTLIMLIILILFMTLYTMFDIATIIVILDSSYQKKRIKVMDAVSISLKKLKRVLSIKNIPLAFLVLFLIPFLSIGISSSFIATIKIPEFIYDFIVNNKVLLCLFIILYIFLVIVLLKWIYSLHYFVLEDLSFKEARKKSKNLSEKNLLKDIISLVLVQLLILLLYLVYIVILILLIILFNKIFGSMTLIKSITSTIIWILLLLSLIIISLLSTPISYAVISVMYYFRKNEKKESIKFIEINERKEKESKKVKVLVIVLSVISIVLGTMFTYGLYKGKYNLNIEYVRTMEVTAHRGASVSYPENTMSAFIGAKEMGADYIELDVQQTKDKEIIVSHDTNLKRVTGVNKEVIDLDYSEIEKLDAGSFFDKKFKGEKIPLLKDVVKWAKENNMRLNIELKPTGKEKDFEKSVVDIINSYDYKDYSVITSQVYSVLENIKKYDKDIETVYVMSLAVGDITELRYADHFSVEASNVNKALINKVHKEGKSLYVWTINTKENIVKMINYNVDNIITDNITLAKETIAKSKRSNLINEYIRIVESIF